MKQWYDGYDLKGIQIYNPRSVVMSLLGHDFDSYWTKTETYEALKKYIQMDVDQAQTRQRLQIADGHILVNRRVGKDPLKPGQSRPTLACHRMAALHPGCDPALSLIHI